MSSYESWDTRNYGRTDEQKKPAIEVGAPPKNFKFQNLQEKPAEEFHHVFYSFFVATFHTHMFKPVYSKN